MIITEIIDNKFTRTYSDIGVYIHGGFPEGDYVEAVDPISENRTYVETNIPIEEIEEDIDPYAEAGRILMGVIR